MIISYITICLLIKNNNLIMISYIRIYYPIKQTFFSYTLAYYITNALTINKDLIIPLLTNFNSVSNKMKWRIIDSIINMVEKSNLKKKNDKKIEEKVQKLEDFIKNNF